MTNNFTMLIGNLTRDADVKQLQNGTKLVQFSIAVNDYKKVGEKWETTPNFIECTSFSTFAVNDAGRLQKGVSVVITGKLRQERWEASDGQHRSKISILCDNVQLLSKPNKVSNQNDSFDDTENIPF